MNVLIICSNTDQLIHGTLLNLCKGDFNKLKENQDGKFCIYSIFMSVFVTKPTTFMCFVCSPVKANISF